MPYVMTTTDGATFVGTHEPLLTDAATANGHRVTRTGPGVEPNTVDPELSTIATAHIVHYRKIDKVPQGMKA